MITGNKARLTAAQRLLSQFRQAGHQSVRGKPAKENSTMLLLLQQSLAGWPVSRDDFWKQLTDRLAGRDEPNQKETSYCGPAAFLYCLLQDRPDLYVAYAIALWTQGRYRVQTGASMLDLTATEGAKDALAAIHRVPLTKRKQHVSDLDWMTMSSLSASTRPGGSWWGPPKPNDQAQSVSYPWVVRSWFAAVGSRPRVDTMHLGLFKRSLPDLLQAMRYWSSCWIVLQIDSSLLEGGKTNTFQQRHWVVVDPTHLPLVKMGDKGPVIPLGDLAEKLGKRIEQIGDDEENDMAAWPTNLKVVTWGQDNYAMWRQTLGHLQGRLYGAFAFPRFR